MIKSSLRGFGAFLAGCKGNRYVTTVHVINSVIVKASKLTKVGKVYRGVSGMALPAPGLMLPAFALIGVFAGRAVTRRALR